MCRGSFGCERDRMARGSVARPNGALATDLALRSVLAACRPSNRAGVPPRNLCKWRQHRRSGQHNQDQFSVGRELERGHDPRCSRHHAASPRPASPREGPPRAARPSEVRRARLAQHLHHRAVPCSQLKEVGEVLGHLRRRPLHLRARPRPRAVRRDPGCLPQPRPRARRAGRGGAGRRVRSPCPPCPRPPRAGPGPPPRGRSWRRLRPRAISGAGGRPPLPGGARARGCRAGGAARCGGAWIAGRRRTVQRRPAVEVAVLVVRARCEERADDREMPPLRRDVQRRVAPLRARARVSALSPPRRRCTWAARGACGAGDAGRGAARRRSHRGPPPRRPEPAPPARRLSARRASRPQPPHGAGWRSNPAGCAALDAGDEWPKGQGPHGPAPRPRSLAARQRRAACACTGGAG